MKRQPVTRRGPVKRTPRKGARVESAQLRLGFRTRLALRGIEIAGYVK